jgi:hypothetical protein
VHKMTFAAQSVPCSSHLSDASHIFSNGVCGHDVWLTSPITGCRYDGRGIDTQHKAGSCVLGILLLSIQFVCGFHHHAAQHAWLVVSCRLAPCSSSKFGCVTSSSLLVCMQPPVCSCCCPWLRLALALQSCSLPLNLWHSVLAGFGSRTSTPSSGQCMV